MVLIFAFLKFFKNFFLLSNDWKNINKLNKINIKDTIKKNNLLLLLFIIKKNIK